MSLSCCGVMRTDHARPWCRTGIVHEPELQAAVARMTVECTATDLGPALGTMLLRLFPHLFKVRHDR